MARHAKRTKRRTRGTQTSFLLRLPEQLHQELKVFATTQRQSLNGIAVGVLQEWWDRHPMRGQIASVARVNVQASPVVTRPPTSRKKAEPHE